MEQKRIEQENLNSRYVDTQKSIARLNNTINIAQNTRQHHECKQQKEINTSRRSRLEQNALRGKSQETEAKQRAIIQKKLDEQMSIQQSLSEQMRNETIKIPILNKPFYSKELIRITGLSFSYGDKKVFDNFDFTLLAETLNTWVDGLKDAIRGFVNTITWDSILEGSKNFLGEIS